MNEDVETALAAAFPDREVVDVDDAGVSWNEGNRTVAVEFVDGGRAYLKVAVDGDGSRAARERAAMAYVNAHTDAPVPTVLARDRDREHPYIATADVSGRVAWRAWDGAGDDERAALARALGRTLARVHVCRFDSHGHVVGGDADALELDRGSWTDVLLDTIEFTRVQAGDGRFAYFFDDVVDLVEANRDRLNDAPAALLHGDPAQPNAFVVEAGGPPTVGLLDWELAHVGDPVRELQRAKRQFVQSTFDPGTDRHVDAFYDGYREQDSGLPAGFEDRYRLYDAVTYLGVSGFFEKWEGRVDESTEAIAADVREEMTRRLDAAGGDGHE